MKDTSAPAARPLCASSTDTEPFTRRTAFSAGNDGSVAQLRAPASTATPAGRSIRIDPLLGTALDVTKEKAKGAASPAVAVGESTAACISTPTRSGPPPLVAASITAPSAVVVVMPYAPEEPTLPLI